MKSLLFVSICIVLAAMGANLAAATPLGTGFTYQGQLNQNGGPINGNVNLRFSLYDAPTNGSHLGASQIAANVPVTNGLFTVLLNDGGQFGVSAFNGDARWLEVEVCTTPGCTSTTILSPRQPLTGTPYALTATKPWLMSGNDISFSGGNVGIGTTAPAAKVDVRGDVKLGSAGQYFATGGEENLRIIRGVINQNGGIIAGSGFSVFHGTVGIYEIGFFGAFSAPPALTATVEYTPPAAPLFAMTDGVVGSAATILLITHAGVPGEGAFHFIAIGPK